MHHSSQQQATSRCPDVCVPGRPPARSVRATLPSTELDLERVLEGHREAEEAAIERYGRGSREAFGYRHAARQSFSQFWRPRLLEHARSQAVASFHTPSNQDQIQVLHRSLIPGGGFRITDFSLSYGGPTGHAEYPDLERAVEALPYRCLPLEGCAAQRDLGEALQGGYRATNAIRSPLDNTLHAAEWVGDDLRHITNSCGRLLGSTSADRAAFWAWFGDSQVVDGHGRPHVVFKGALRSDWRSGKDITEFRSANGPWSGFFTSSRPVAEGFADAFAHMGESVVHAVYLCMRQHHVVDAAQEMASSFQFDHPLVPARRPDLRQMLVDGSGDGVEIQNTRDEATVFVPRLPQQVRILTTTPWIPQDGRRQAGS